MNDNDETKKPDIDDEAMAPTTPAPDDVHDVASTDLEPLAQGQAAAEAEALAEAAYQARLQAILAEDDAPDDAEDAGTDQQLR
jgi:hypothetical protein